MLIKILINIIITQDMDASNKTTIDQDWYEENNIPLYGIKENPEQNWSNSPKGCANIYIDDMALGCPLTDEGFVDWKIIDNQ